MMMKTTINTCHGRRQRAFSSSAHAVTVDEKRSTCPLVYVFSHPYVQFEIMLLRLVACLIQMAVSCYGSAVACFKPGSTRPRK